MDQLVYFSGELKLFYVGESNLSTKRAIESLE